MDDFLFFWFFMVFVKILLTSSSWLLSLSKRMCSTNSMCFSVQPLWNIWKMFTECLYQLFVSVNKNMFQANEKNARTMSILVALVSFLVTWNKYLLTRCVVILEIITPAQTLSWFTKMLWVVNSKCDLFAVSVMLGNKNFNWTL